MTGQRNPVRGNIAEVQPLLTKVVRAVCDHVDEERLRVYLFGSWARGRALPISDLDIALDTGRPIEPAIFMKIADALDELPTLRRVDVLDLQSVDQEFRSRVLQEGVLVYGK